ncbi:Smr/MutS family protein [Owenweeksia hongkongensis]|uniref:Smr/MutS family protein n=1 Tax=Owenweeksia hongkongensis TaxID=253245 RepID=UPI003A8EAAA7
MKFKLGDTVSFLNQIGEGVITKCEQGRYLVEDEHGFDDWYEERELVAKNNLKIDGVQFKDTSADAAPRKDNGASSLLEKDLHFNKLVEFPKNFSNHQMLEIQLREARNFLDRSKKGGNKRVVLIHGVGEGRLKEEIHTMLERMDNLRFYDASYAEYGRGATEIEFY